MPPKIVSKKSLASNQICRRSRRIANRIKAMVKVQSVSLKELSSSTKERVRLPNRKKSMIETQPASSNEQSLLLEDEQQSSTKESEETSYNEKSVAESQPASSEATKPFSTKKNQLSSSSKKSVTKRQLASSSKGQSKSTTKRRRVMKSDEINEHDYSIYIQQLLEELSPDLTISEKAIADMNNYLKHVFESLAEISRVLLVERKDDLTDKDIETAVNRVVEGQLAIFCIAEGRRAVKKMEGRLI